MPATATRLEAPATDDIVQMYVRRNPGVPIKAARTAGKATAVLSRALLRLSPDEQQSLAGLSETDLRRLLSTMIGPSAQREQLPAPSSTLLGEGLAAPLGEVEARQRITARNEQVEIEDWAGTVAGSTALERDYGIARSTLYEWQRLGAVVGLLKGRKAHVFPVAQFIDGRPIEGLDEIVSVIGSGRAAWFWLVTPHSELNDLAPLELLKSAKVDEVRVLAERDYGQP